MSSVQLREGLPIDQMPEWSGSALQKRRRRFNSGSGLQAPVARAERHRSSKSAHAGSNPVWSSIVFRPRSSKDERRFPTSEDARSNRVAVGKLESELGGCPASPAKR